MSAHLVAAYLRRLETCADEARKSEDAALAMAPGTFRSAMVAVAQAQRETYEHARDMAASHFGPVVREEPGA